MNIDHGTSQNPQVKQRWCGGIKVRGNHQFRSGTVVDSIAHNAHVIQHQGVEKKFLEGVLS